MREDFSTSAWADHSPKFFQDIADGLAGIRAAFRRLAAIQFAAPWKEARSGKREACTDC